jgi:cell division protein ZipA
MDLQLALLSLGALVVAIVALSAYDKWQVLRRFSRLRTAPSSVGMVRRDALDINLAPPDAQQRVLRTADKTGARPRSGIDEELSSIEQAAALPIAASDELGFPLGLESDQVLARDRAHMPDEGIDFVIGLPGLSPIPRDRALGIYKQHEYLLEKPRRLFGRRRPALLWTNLQQDPEQSEYTDLALSIQLADQQGPISESELNTFVQLGLKLADGLGRHTRLSMTFERALVRGTELHTFCDVYDVFASVNITANHMDGFRGRLVEQVALRQGMEFGALNIFHMKNNNALGCRHLFSMANLFKPGEFDLATLDTFRTHGLTLFMAVPCVYQPRQAFDKMVATAKGFCRMLGGKMLDHDRRPLSEQGLAAIRAQIDQIATEMIRHGVVPGGTSALRLFNHE